MRRTLLSCTSLARHGLIALATALLLPAAPAFAGDLTITQAISAWLDLNHQEFAALTTALSLLGFTVVAAILLMRTRIRAAANELRLRSDIADLQVQADRLRALLFAEPQILIAWAAGDNRPQISGDTSLLISQDAEFAAAHPRLWNLAAAGTGAADGPCGRCAARGRRRLSAQSLHLDRPRHRSDGPRHRRASHCADSRTRRIAPGTRRIQSPLQDAAGRNRTAARLRRRGALADLGQERRGQSALRQCGLCAGHRGRKRRRRDPPQPRTAGQRPARRDGPGAERQCQPSARGCRSWSAASGASTTCRRSKLSGGSAGIAIDASEATALRAAMERMAEAHRRTLDQLSSGVAVFDGQRRLAFYNESYRRLWDLDQAFLDCNPDDSSVLDRLRAARKLPEQPDFRAWKAKLHEAYRAIEPRERHLVPARRPRRQRRHHAQSRRRRHLSVRQCHRKPRSGAAIRPADPRPARDARQPRRSGRGVRQQRPRAAVQSGFCERCGSCRRKRSSEQPHIETVEAWCKPLFDDDADLADAARSDHRDRQPHAGAAEARAQGRQRAGLHDHAAARRRDHADLPGHHRYRECRARAARTQRGAGGRRPDEGRFRPPRLLRTALAADHHHRLRAFPQRSLDRPADAEAGRISRLHHHIDQRAAGASPTTSSISPPSMPAP